jgi:low affinity Fe/Cu permease
MSNISLVETDQINEKIQVILRQTDYTEEIALEKLKDNNFDEIKTIKSYFGIEEKKPSQIKSINQEIFKQIRYKLDSNMRDYNARVERGEVKKVV